MIQLRKRLVLVSNSTERARYVMLLPFPLMKLYCNTIQPILQPTTVKTRMLPVRESFGSVTQRSCYKIEVYVIPGILPGYYLV
jgi:hypothetical protein